MGFGGNGGSSSVAGSSDVALNVPLDNEVLTYDSSTSKWKNATTSAAPVQSVAGKTGTVTLVKADVGLGNVDNTADSAKPVSSATQTALDAKQDTSAKGQSNGYASLDGSSLVPRSQLGTGTADSTKVLLGNGTWATPAAAPVQSVASKTGVVSLVKADVGLGNVDNTADSAKPVSTATQTALDAKAATSHNHSATNITSGTIDVARLPAATEVAIGAVELSTTSEAVTGTDTTRAVTPAGVSAAVTAALHPVVFVDSLGDIPVGTPVDTLVVVRAA